MASIGCMSAFKPMQLGLLFTVVSRYTQNSSDKFNLSQIKLLAKRYHDIEIGWSTHEDPEDMTAVMMAVAAGATMLERHVGLESNGHKLNKYSSTPEQIERWLQKYNDAKLAMGGTNRAPASEVERAALKVCNAVLI